MLGSAMSSAPQRGAPATRGWAPPQQHLRLNHASVRAHLAAGRASQAAELDEDQMTDTSETSFYISKKQWEKMREKENEDLEEFELLEKDMRASINSTPHSSLIKLSPRRGGSLHV